VYAGQGAVTRVECPDENVDNCQMVKSQ